MKIQSQSTTNQRQCTDLCRATSSVWNFLGLISSGGRSELERVRRDVRLLRLPSEQNGVCIKTKSTVASIQLKQISFVFQIEKLRVGHDGRGAAADWYVEEVILNSAFRGEHLIFPCHAWVVEELAVGYADKELHPKQPGEFNG